MSWLSNFLNPVNAARSIVDPAGATITSITGQDASNPRNWIDPAGITGSTASSNDAPAAPISANPNNSTTPNYFGNASDPSFGSFTKPFDISEFYKYQDPGYSFRLQQGNQGVMNSAAAGSGALSGSALKDLLSFNQDAASQEYGNAFNRYQTTQGNIFSRLAQLAGLGQASASNVGTQGTALAGQAGQAIQNQGTAQGGGIVGAGNALSNAGSTFGAYQWLANNPGMWHGSTAAVSP